MPADLIGGYQWGDEGKGKLVDEILGGGIAPGYDIEPRVYTVNARWNGGGNAGHTVIVGNERYALHHLPSGIVRENIKCVAGHGMVIDDDIIWAEISNLRKRGKKVDPENLYISENAHLITMHSKRIDALSGGRVGTTGRGIGPTYAGKKNRTNPRVIDILRGDIPDYVKEGMNIQNFLIEQYYGDNGISINKELDRLKRGAERLAPFVADTVSLLNNWLEQGENVLGEAGQGFYLDIDLGSYPFVTSSNPTPGGALTGLGIPPHAIRDVIGITRAYFARVGEGPLPGEWGEYDEVKRKEDPKFGGTVPGPLTDEEIARALSGDRYWMGRWVRVDGGEFGTTTGRPRRTAEPNWELLKHAGRVAGLTYWVVTKLDVLGGKPVRPILGHHTDMSVYGEEYKWPKITDEQAKEMVAGGFDSLPDGMQRFLEDFGEFTEIPVGYASISPKRGITVKRDVFKNTDFTIRRV